MPLPTCSPVVSLTGWELKVYLWAIFVWSLGACLHALCGWATEETLGIHNAEEMLSATGAVASTIAITSVYYFIAARIVLGVGEAGNFPAAIKVTAEYFPKRTVHIPLPSLMQVLQ